MDDDEIVSGDEREPNKKQALAKARAVIEKLDQLQDEYFALDPEAKALIPESVRRFFEKS